MPLESDTKYLRRPPLRSLTSRHRHSPIQEYIRVGSPSCERSSSLFPLVGELEPRFGNRCRSSAIGETTGYSPAFRHAFDSQRIDHSGSAVLCLVPQTAVLATQFRQSCVQCPCPHQYSESGLIVSQAERCPEFFRRTVLNLVLGGAWRGSARGQLQELNYANYCSQPL